MTEVNQSLVFGTFKGLDKKHDFLGLEYLKEAVNVDFDAAGRIRRRSGHRVIVQGAVSSLWSDGDTCLYVQGGILRRLGDDMATFTDITPVNGDVCYYSAIGNVYFSDGVNSWVLKDGVARRWGIPRPPSPSLALTDGEMPSGRYMVAVTHVASDGRESGASNFAVIEGGGGISITNIAQPSDGFARIYATSVNGDTLFRVADLRNGETTATFYGDTSNVPLRSGFAEPAPPGHLICYYKGIMYVADGNVIWYSDPYQPERFQMARNYIQMSNRITMMMPVQDGIFVSDGEVKFLRGSSPKDFNVILCAEYDAIEGTAQHFDAKYMESVGKGVIFATPRGICVGLPGGSFRNLTEDGVAFPHGFRGVGHVRRANGLVQYLCLISGDNGEPVNNYTPDVGQVEIR